MGIVLICMHLGTVLILERRSKKEYVKKLSGQLNARYFTFQIGQIYFHTKALPKL